MDETKEALVVIEKEIKQPNEDHQEHSDQQINLELLDPKKPIWKPLLFFLMPLIGSNILQSLGGTVSSIIVGQGIGESALATINVVMPLIFFLHSFIIGIGGASSVLIGQAFGAGDKERMRSIVNTSLKFSFFLGLTLAVVGVLLAPKLLTWIQTPVSIMNEAGQFARIIFASLPLTFVYIIYTTFLRGTGDSKTPFYFLFISTLINIIIAPILALGLLGFPALSVKGIALAMVISNFVTLLILFLYLKKVKHLLAIDSTLFSTLKMDTKILRLMIGIGLPSGIQMILVSLSQIAVVHLINAYGIQATAAYGAVMQIVTYVQMPALSLGMAIGVFGSQLIGAKVNQRMTELLKSGFWLNYMMGIFLVGLTYLFSRSILSLFLVEASTIALAENILFLVLWSYLLFGNSIVISGLMRSSGTVFWPTVIGVSSVWGVQVPFAYILSQIMDFGLKGIWMAYPIGFSFSLVAQYLYYRFRWKGKNHEDLFQTVQNRH